MKNFDARESALLDVRLLQLFELLYSTGSVTRAAEALGQRQPTVSIWLAKLREALHDPLFVRTPSGMQPTPRADALMPAVREALDAMRRLSQAPPGFNPATARRLFRICMSDASHMTLLPQLLAHIRGLAPGVRLEAARIDADAPRALQTGDADLAIGLLPDLDAGFYQQVLFDQDWVCLVNPAHPRIGASLTLAQYEAEEHIGIVSGTGQQLVEAALREHRVCRRLRVDLPGFLGLPGIALTSDLVATLPRMTGETLARTHGLRLLPCPVPIAPFTVKQHWHARYHHDSANRWLRGACATLLTRA